MAQATIKQGSRGPDVIAWQKVIGVKADGIFGSGTAAATKAWQKNNGLNADGIVGAKSWAKAQPALDQYGPPTAAEHAAAALAAQQVPRIVPKVPTPKPQVTSVPPPTVNAVSSLYAKVVPPAAQVKVAAAKAQVVAAASKAKVTAQGLPLWARIAGGAIAGVFGFAGYKALAKK
jgi:peptidoglycan hydrolase-like protein with peptidoglycan-binding domain